MIRQKCVNNGLLMLLTGLVVLPAWSGNVNQSDRVQGMAQFMNESADNIQWLWLAGIAIGVLVFLLFIRWIHYAMIKRHKPRTRSPVNKDYAQGLSIKKKSGSAAQPKTQPRTPKPPTERKRRY
jgi:hypothetical protein